MSSKLKVNNVPCDYCLWLARYVSHFNKNNSGIRISKKRMKKTQSAFGFSFNKTALRMKDLGYKPKIHSYAVDSFDCMGMGDRTINLPLKPHKGKKK